MQDKKFLEDSLHEKRVKRALAEETLKIEASNHSGLFLEEENTCLEEALLQEERKI